MRSISASATIGRGTNEWLPTKSNDGVKFKRQDLIDALCQYQHNDKHSRKLAQSRTHSLAGLGARLWRKLEWGPRMTMVNAIRSANSSARLHSTLAQCWRSNVQTNGKAKGDLAKLVATHLNRLRRLSKPDREELDRELSAQGAVVEMQATQGIS